MVQTGLTHAASKSQSLLLASEAMKGSHCGVEASLGWVGLASS
jgi:hypothetical protein